jgi:SpoVK/Ycf46/Vps4 family AAA+-type ATPase
MGMNIGKILWSEVRQVGLNLSQLVRVWLRRISSQIDKLFFSPLEVPVPPSVLCNTGIYDPALIHANTDLFALAKGLANCKFGQICLYGPSGTGKTAFARWLANQMGVPLLEKRSSDLISPYIGETERNIAEAFREAKCSQSLLLIDEVDSFLQDRRGARHSWEITAVNEMLTQMESYSGLFIASTNFMDSLDQAVLRRFDLKVKFDYLKPEQAWQMLVRQSDSMGINEPSDISRSELARLAVLTPGDFAVVARQHRFRPLSNASEFIAALKQECDFKEDGRKSSIGFYATT